MEELMEKLQGILNSKEGQDQLSNIASMLSGNNNSNQTQNQNQNQNPPNSGFDFSSLASMFANSNNNSSNNNTTNTNNNQQENNSNTQSGGFDLSSLAGLFGGNNNSSNTNSDSTSAMPNIDMATILKLQQVFKSMNVNDKNSQLLLALKPHFSDKRQTKVDQAITMMRMFSMFPALKESGILKGFLF